MREKFNIKLFTDLLFKKNIAKVVKYPNIGFIFVFGNNEVVR